MRRRPAAIGLALTGGTLLLFAVKGYLSFLTVVHLGGRDLASNYAFTWLMEQNLLHGELLRWSNRWMLGFPSFAFYPPLFFLFVAGLHLLTGQLVPLLAWFRLVVFGSLLLVPATTYWSFRDTVGDTAAVFAGLHTSLFLFVYPPVSQAFQVLSGGLVAQGLATLLLLPGLGLLYRDTVNSAVLGGAILGLATLAHPFVGAAGFLAAGSYAALQRSRRSLIPLATGAAVVAPWLVNAARYLPYLSTYTMGAAELGLFPVLLLPLAVIGGYDTVELRSLLAAFLALLGLSAVELPVITQEIRLFTYALLFGSILAGIGAYRVYTHLAGRYGRRRVVAGLVLLPGLLLVLQTQPDQHWQLGYDPGPVYSELEKQPAGRVMVETVNSSVYDSYALQGMLPVHTRHAAVNDVHLDSSPSASYILTLESWISTTMVHNPICRTCDTTAPPPLVDRRLDDLGVRYVLTRTGSAGERMAAAMHRIGPAGPYTLFENTDGYRLVEPVQREPVALVGTWQQWRHVNDRLFVSNLSVPVTWHRAAPDHRDRFSAVIRMGAGAATVVDRLRSISLQPTPPASVNATVTADRVAITANRSGPVRVKLSYLPTHRSQAALYAAAFNTMIVYPDPEATIRLDRPRPGQPRASDP